MLRTLLAILMLNIYACAPVFAATAPERVQTHVFLNDSITTDTSSAKESWTAGKATFQATGAVSASTGAATVIFYGSNVNSSALTDWVSLCTVTLALSTTSAGDGCAINADWRYYKAKVSSISGTNASVDAIMGAAK